LWIVRINAAARSLGMNYSGLLAALTKANVQVDRKILADLAVADFSGFAAVVDVAKAGVKAAA